MRIKEDSEDTDFWITMSARATRPEAARETCSARKFPPSLPHPTLQDSSTQICLAQSSALGIICRELDPVAESSEEAEAASGSSELGPCASQDSTVSGTVGL